jgi:MHS family shikimate/dehydroshikimate transporter-like MFS transporter
MYFGYAAMFVTVVPFFVMLSSGSMAIVVLAFVMAGISSGFMYGPYAALLCEAFEARVRYTGISLGLTIGGVLGSAFSPMLFTELFRLADSWMPVAGAVMISAIISASAVAALKSADGVALAAPRTSDSLDEQPPATAATATTPS